MQILLTNNRIITQAACALQRNMATGRGAKHMTADSRQPPPPSTQNQQNFM